MKIYSIFPSIDGEVNAYSQGCLTTFIRMANCNLRCKYCDTLYAVSSDAGTEMSVEDVMEQVNSIGIKRVTITGGEPLVQLDNFLELTRHLYRGNYLVSVETNGTFPCTGYGVGSWVVDYKLPSSGCMDAMTDDAFVKLSANDFVKFVIADEVDFDRAVSIKNYFQEKLQLTCKFAFSPSHDVLDPNVLIKWLLGHQVLDAIVNIQLHKVCNLEESQ
jgi:7-carboxy-7-deazaguanine synthase